jgi:predicted dehydrogenase
MGSGHIDNIRAGKINNMKLTAICDIDDKKLAAKKELIGDVKCFSDSTELIRSGEVDAILIATPHYFHPIIAIEGFKNGLNVLTEKPAGVYTKAVREMNEAAKKSGKVFGIMYNQRTNPAYQKLREMLQGGELGEFVRANWIITDWYRTQAYYNSGGWRATWKGEGGGVLLNQDPHQIDLMQWICGIPKRVRAFCQFGKYHDIEVEDDVTAYYEYANGATGLFVTTTGEYPGTNRFEVSGDKGKVVIEGGKFIYYKNSGSVKEYTYNSDKGFGRLDVKTEELTFPGGGDQHVGILNNFIDSILTGAPLLAPGYEGINGLTVSNAMHMSAWTDNWVDIPFDENKYYELLQDKIKNSRISKKDGSDKVFDVKGTF